MLAASDESFGAKEALLSPAPVAFAPGTYDHKGEVVDGWETRRRRGPGADWVVVRLGLPGCVRTLDVDTTSFSGNAPVSCRLEACAVPEGSEPGGWEQVLGDSQLVADNHNVLTVADLRRWTHLRLWVTPDGGVGRFRVHGEPVLDPRPFEGLTVDLASEELGARVTFCSDEFYSPASALLRADRPRTMGQGWEARRRRGPGHDVVVVRLGLAGSPTLLELDTTWFLHNASGAGALWTASCPTDPDPADDLWQPLLSLTPLQPDARHRFRVAGPVATHVRFDAHPDGGLARLRVLGPVAADAQAQALVRWYDALPDSHAALENLPPSGRPFVTAAALRAADAGLARRLGL